MRKIIAFVLIFLLIATMLLVVSCNKDNNENIKDIIPEGGIELKVMNFNIRQSKAGDYGLQSWDIRKSEIINEVKDKMPDILCMQEVHKDQYNYILNKLYDTYNIVWYSRSVDRTQEGLLIAYLD